MKTLALAGAALLAATASPALAAPTITTTAPAGMTTTFTSVGYRSYAAGTTATINGIKVTSDSAFYDAGVGGGGYGFGSNGAWRTLSWVAADSAVNSFTFDLGGNYQSAGAFLNYAPGYGDPFITALDDTLSVIGSFDLSVFAPVFTEEDEAGAFRGIQSDTANIRYLRLGGAYIAANSVTAGDAVSAAVPEPATWAMMLVGFGGIGFAMRRRKSKVATTVAYA